MAVKRFHALVRQTMANRRVGVEKTGCIRAVFRVKNMFCECKKWQNLADYSYADIKMNVLVETSNYKMIAEIQFLAKFMLKAKKMGHIFYGFVRNDIALNQIKNLNTTQNSNNLTIKDWIRMIATQNYQALVMHILYSDAIVAFKDKQKDFHKLLHLCKKNKWNKGHRLLKDAMRYELDKIHESANWVGQEQNTNVNRKNEDVTVEKKVAEDDESARLTQLVAEATQTEMAKADVAHLVKEMIRTNRNSIAQQILDGVEKHRAKDLNYIVNESRFFDSESSLLMVAVYYHNKEMVSILTEKYKADLEFTCTDGRNALWNAVFHGFTDIAQILLKAGANPNVLIGEETMLKKAIEIDNLELMKLLIKYNFDMVRFVNHRHTHGFTLFHICCHRGRFECLKYFVNVCKEIKGCEIDIHCKAREFNILHLMASGTAGRADVAEYIFNELNWVVTCKDKNVFNAIGGVNNTPLGSCCSLVSLGACYGVCVLIFFCCTFVYLHGCIYRDI